jgi:hypothetical protein
MMLPTTGRIRPRRSFRSATTAGSISSVNDQFEAPHPNGAVVVNDTDDGHPTDPRRRRRRRRIFVVVALIIAAAWAYAIWFSVTRGSPEDLDAAATAEVSAACTSARDQLDALPDFTPQTTGTENVQLVRQENAIFDTMMRPSAKSNRPRPAREPPRRWLDDWRNLGERAACRRPGHDEAPPASARPRQGAACGRSAERMNGFAQREISTCVNPTHCRLRSSTTATTRPWRTDGRPRRSH